MSARPDIPVVSLRDAAEVLGISIRAAESALRNHGIRSGYPLAAVEWLRDNRPGRGARTDLHRGAAMERNWTLTADMTAFALSAAIAEKLAGQIQPSVTGGRFATVTVRAGSTPPAWMTELQHERPEADIVID